jgi:predicted AlkP superfamily pyrophosphatase or phosphodiesterase
MKRRTCILLAVLVMLGRVSPGAEDSSTTKPDLSPFQHLIVISVDGMRPESYLAAESLQLKVPTLSKLMREGAYSEGVQPVFPSVTYPSHTTLVTGTNPGKHGIVTNLAWDPLNRNENGWRWYSEDIRVPTLWDRARAHGLRASLLGWPVTVGAQADLRIPDIWRTYQLEDMKLIRSVSTDGAFAGAGQSHDLATRYMSIASRDDMLTEIACHNIIQNHPNLLLLHLISVDFQQHFHGPLSPEAKAAIEKSDQNIAKVLAAVNQAGLWEQSAVVVLSDHGFTAVSTDVHLGVLLAQEGFVTLRGNHVREWKAVSVSADGTAYIYVKDAQDSETKKKLVSLLQPLVGKEGSGIRRLLNHDEIVALGGDPNAFLAVEAADSFAFADGYPSTYLSPDDMHGTHGYFPDRKEMQASFIAYSPRIKGEVIQNIRLVDIAPTLAGWLGLKLEDADGKPFPIQIRQLH